MQYNILQGGIAMIKFDLSNGQKPEFPGPRPWYDTREGIENSLASLESFNQLISARHQAGYGREERLSEFYVLGGRYSLDTCGNCSKAVGNIPKELYSDIPDVMTRDEFWQFIRTRAGEEMSISFALNGGDIPSSDLLCSYCSKEWEIVNCHDTLVQHTNEVFPLTEFVGKTLEEVKLAYFQRVDAIYRMQPDILIRNDRFIDLSPKYPNPEKEYQKGIIKNERGWVSERDGIADDYVIQVGDEGFFNVWKYFHSECHVKSVADNPEFLCKDGGFKNLAGAAYADILIEKELNDAGIEIVKGNRTQSEVPFTLTGKLGTFSFVRAWTYWMVDCMMPLEVAKEMYADEVGAKFVRVSGNAGCPPPEEWAFPCSEDLKKGMTELGLESTTYGELAEILNSGKIIAPRFVQSYHIDTMPGLKLFVETAKKHGLV